MPYTFSTLNDRDLEDLDRDLLSKKINVRFQSFKPGKDKGVDLRYSSPDEANDIIVQVKHYQASGYKKLKSDLIKNELPKVVRLEPRRYIWEKPFLQQTSLEGQLFLTTLFSFGSRRVERKVLEKAFNHRIQHKVTNQAA
jgi:hypothetical protein